MVSLTLKYPGFCTASLGGRKILLSEFFSAKGEMKEMEKS